MLIPERELFVVLRELRQFLNGEWQRSDPSALKDALDKLFTRAEREAREPLHPAVVELIEAGKPLDAVHMMRNESGISVRDARRYVYDYATAIAGKK